MIPLWIRAIRPDWEKWFPFQEVLQVFHLAFAFVQFNLAVPAYEGDTGAVIASVLKPMQPFDNDGTRLAVPDITYDSTHNGRICLV